MAQDFTLLLQNNNPRNGWKGVCVKRLPMAVMSTYMSSTTQKTLIRELKTYKLVDQYLFHTEKALATLRFIEAFKIGK